jgi:hypothetical protein
MKLGEVGVMPPQWPRFAKQKDICIISTNDDFSSTPKKTRVSNQMSLNFPVLGVVLVYNLPQGEGESSFLEQ